MDVDDPVLLAGLLPNTICTGTDASEGFESNGRSLAQQIAELLGGQPPWWLDRREVR